MLAMLSRLTPRRVLLLGAAIAALAAVLVLLWYFVLRSDAPPPASLEAAVESVRADQQAQQSQPAPQAQQQAEVEQTQAVQSAQQTQAAQSEAPQQQESEPVSAAAADYGDDDEQSAAADSGSEQSAAEQTAAGQAASAEQSTSTEQAASAEQTAPAEQQQAAAQSAGAAELPALADLAGAWVLSERGDSFVGYRIGEVLANIGTATAVGRTSEITAALAFDGAAITSVEIVADLRTLKSDQSFRDGALRDRGLESDTYPFAAFRLTEPIPIDRLPVAGDTLSLTVSGSLELHGVTNPVEIALEGQYVDGLVVVSGSTEIVLTDYEIEAPVGFRVLSIEESGQMEFQIIFEPAP